MIGRFRARLTSGPMLLDAAIGTRLIAQGLDLATDSGFARRLLRDDRGPPRGDPRGLGT